MKLSICLLFLICIALPAMAVEDFNNPLESDIHSRGLWHFDQSSGDTIAVDSGPFGNHGELITGLSYELDPDTCWVAGKSGFGNCVETYWDSATDYNIGVISVPQSAE